MGPYAEKQPESCCMRCGAWTTAHWYPLRILFLGSCDLEHADEAPGDNVALDETLLLGMTFSTLVS